MISRSPRRGLRLPVVVVLAGLLLGMLSAVAAAQQDGPAVDVLRVSGPIDGRVAGYIDRSITRAENEGVEVVVLQLDTVGGVGIDVDAVTQRIIDSQVPVAVWIGGPGARVAGAGVFIANAAHALSMAPATVMGGAAPDDLIEGEPDAASRAATADRLASLAELRGRDAATARAMAEGAAVVALGQDAPEGTALPEDAELPHGVDPDNVTLLDDAALVSQAVAEFGSVDLDDVLRDLDGHEVLVAAADGGPSPHTLDVDPVTTTVRFNNMGLWDRILHTMASPSLTYLLLISGALMILFEVYQPGFGVAGITGAGVFALGIYGLVVLPVSWLAFALLMLGLLLLALDLAIAGLGVPTAAGGIALTAGSLLLFNGPPPLQLPLWLVILVVAFNLLFFVIIMTTVLRAQGVQAMAGAEQVIGKVGVVRSMLNPEGHVYIDGALWRARAPAETPKVKTGTQVRAIGLNDGLTLDVEIHDPDRAGTPV